MDADIANNHIYILIYTPNSCNGGGTLGVMRFDARAWQRQARTNMHAWRLLDLLGSRDGSSFQFGKGSRVKFFLRRDQLAKNTLTFFFFFFTFIYIYIYCSCNLGGQGPLPAPPKPIFAWKSQWPSERHGDKIEYSGMRGGGELENRTNVRIEYFIYYSLYLLSFLLRFIFYLN
jgi:hypothetical protein